MGQAKPSEQRWIPRYHSVIGDYHAQLIQGSGSEAREVKARVIDVSRDGLGILVNEALNPGTHLTLIIEDKQIQLQVVYCVKDLIHYDNHRCGLQRMASAENLVNLFSAAGCSLK
jgi:hypothetical protein